MRFWGGRVKLRWYNDSFKFLNSKGAVHEMENKLTWLSLLYFILQDEILILTYFVCKVIAISATSCGMPLSLRWAAWDLTSNQMSNLRWESVLWKYIFRQGKGRELCRVRVNYIKKICPQVICQESTESIELLSYHREFLIAFCFVSCNEKFSSINWDKSFYKRKLQLVIKLIFLYLRFKAYWERNSRRPLDSQPVILCRENSKWRL